MGGAERAMAEERVQRRLAAILAADVVGYSRLMEADEEATLRTLKSHREIIDGLIVRHEGRIFSTAGDSVVAEFRSAVEAVRAAVAIQEELKPRNEHLPNEGKMIFRIGVNLGDIMVEGDNLYGDGINVAARIEGLCAPGEVYVSGSVHGQVEGKLSLGFEDMGEQSVKNIAKPIRVYRVRTTSEDNISQDAIGASLPVTDKPSIAVLPFDNMSNDPEQEYFSDGITEDLITALSRIRQIQVVARNSTFSYKGKSPNIQHVSDELGARYVVEGSVRKAGNRIRVTAQLIDGKTGNHLWAERYDREITDIFDVQDELTDTLVGAIAPGIGSAERQRAKQNPPESLDTWDLYQRGMWHLNRRTSDGMKEEMLEARALFEDVIKRDPEFAPAYAACAETYYYDALFGFGEEELEKALQLAKEAVKLDGDDALAHIALGRIYHINRNSEAAIAENKIALGLSPSSAEAHHRLGSALVYAGKAQEGIPHLETAIRLSPHDELIGPFHVRLAMAQLFLGNHEEAAELAKKAVRLRGTQWGGYAALASALGHLGKIEEAKNAMKEMKDAQPRATISFVKERLPISDPKCMDHFLDGLRKAGVPE